MLMYGGVGLISVINVIAVIIVINLDRRGCSIDVHSKADR